MGTSKKPKPITDDVVLSIAKIHRVLRPLRSKVAALAAVLNQPSIRHAILSDSNTAPTPADPHDLLSSSPASRFYPSSPALAPPTPGDVVAGPSSISASVAFGHLAYRPENARRALDRNSGTLTGKDVSAARISTAVGLGIAHARIGDKIASVVASFVLILKLANPQPKKGHATAYASAFPSLRALAGSLLGPQIEQSSVANDIETAADTNDSDSDEEMDEDDEDESEDDSAVVDQWYEAIPEHLRR